jgi:hypothetical protein
MPLPVMLPDPAVAVIVPPHEVVSPLGVATVIPAGSESVNVAPVKATGFGFVTENVRLVLPPSITVLVPNNLVTTGGSV